MESRRHEVEVKFPELEGRLDRLRGARRSATPVEGHTRQSPLTTLMQDEVSKLETMPTRSRRFRTSRQDEKSARSSTHDLQASGRFG